MKYIKTALLTTLICFFASGCSFEEEVIPKETDVLSFVPVESSDFKDNQTSISETIPIEGETFSIICTYDTKEYPLEEWKVTSNKNIYIDVKTSGLPEGYSVYIEHVHSDIILKSTSASIDGITQDSMDDSDHRNPSKGFPINDKISYTNVFAIEGYTEQFYTLWGHAFGAFGGMYGSVSSSHQRLTEGNLREQGTYAEKLITVYDLIISTPEFPEGYMKSVYSEVLIPLTKQTDSVYVYGNYECIKEININYKEDWSRVVNIKEGDVWTLVSWDEINQAATLRKEDISITLSYEIFKEHFQIQKGN